MQTLVDSYAQSILDTVRDVKPLKVTASGERQSAIELFRVGDDTGKVSMVHVLFYNVFLYTLDLYL